LLRAWAKVFARLKVFKGLVFEGSGMEVSDWGPLMVKVFVMEWFLVDSAKSPSGLGFEVLAVEGV